MAKTRKVIFWVVVAFIVYAIVKSPTQAADLVRTAFNILAQGVQSIFSFFDALLHH